MFVFLKRAVTLFVICNIPLLHPHFSCAFKWCSFAFFFWMAENDFVEQYMPLNLAPLLQWIAIFRTSSGLFDDRQLTDAHFFWYLEAHLSQHIIWSMPFAFIHFHHRWKGVVSWNSLKQWQPTYKICICSLYNKFNLIDTIVGTLSKSHFWHNPFNYSMSLLLTVSCE